MGARPIVASRPPSSASFSGLPLLGAGVPEDCATRSLSTPQDRRQLENLLTAPRRSAPITMTDPGVHDRAIPVFTMTGIRSERPDLAPPDAAGSDHGAGAPAAAPRVAPSLGSREPIRECRLPPRAEDSRDRGEHEPARQLLGQRGGGGFLRYPQGRVGARSTVG